VTFDKKIIFYGEELLALHPITKLPEHPLSPVHIYCPYLEAVSSIYNLRMFHAWWQGTLLNVDQS
jgi:hypothetical protein